MHIISNQITAKLTFKGPTDTKGAHWKVEVEHGDKTRKLGQVGAHSFNGFFDLIETATEIITTEINAMRATWGGKPHTPTSVNASYYGNTTIFLMLTV